MRPEDGRNLFAIKKECSRGCSLESGELLRLGATVFADPPAGLNCNLTHYWPVNAYSAPVRDRANYRNKMLGNVARSTTINLITPLRVGVTLSLCKVHAHAHA